MKHNFSFLPSLRRTTLLALLCLGIMPAFAETVYYFCFNSSAGSRNLYMQGKSSGVVEYTQLNANPDDASYMWRKEEAPNQSFNIDGQTCQVYYLQNVKTGQYLYCSSNIGSGDWIYRTTATGAKQENDYYKWFFDKTGTDSGYDLFMIISRQDPNTNPSYKSFHLHSCNQYNDCTDGQAPKPNVPCGKMTDCNAYAQVKVIPVEYTPVNPCPNCGTVPANN